MHTLLRTCSKVGKLEPVELSAHHAYFRPQKSLVTSRLGASGQVF